MNASFIQVSDVFNCIKPEKLFSMKTTTEFLFRMVDSSRDTLINKN